MDAFLQDDAGDQAAALPRQQVEPAAVGPGDAIDDGQPEPGAARIAARRIETGEGQLQPLDVAGRYARSPIGDVDVNLPAILPQAQLQRSLGASVAQGV